MTEDVAAGRRRSWIIDVRPLRVVPYRRMWLGNAVSFAESARVMEQVDPLWLDEWWCHL